MPADWDDAGLGFEGWEVDEAGTVWVFGGGLLRW